MVFASKFLDNINVFVNQITVDHLVHSLEDFVQEIVVAKESVNLTKLVLVLQDTLALHVKLHWELVEGTTIVPQMVFAKVDSVSATLDLVAQIVVLRATLVELLMLDVMLILDMEFA